MIDILVAVYNGEKYLSEQLESIINQSCTDWHMIICDDGSCDRSFEIIEEYSRRFPEKISVLRNAVPTKSAQANFMGMLSRTKAEYIMFSDQDDFWERDKIRLTLDKMRELEQNGKSNMPVLVHTELSVADEGLNVTKESFTDFQGLNPKCDTLNRLLVQNNVTGCTVMINAPLADIARAAAPSQMLMHDWWLALTAAAFGKIGFVDKPTVKYRQHVDNQLGAVNNRSFSGIKHIIKEKSVTKERIDITYSQAKNFLDIYGDILSEKSAECLRRYIDIPNHGKAARINRLIRGGFLKQNFLAAAGQLVFC